MKKTMKNWRYYVLAALAAVTVAGVFAEPTESLGSEAWLGALVASKLVGVAAGYAVYKLAARWAAQGDIPELTNLITEE